MFEFFEDNYAWNLATAMALNSGGQISEVNDALASIRSVAGGATDGANEAFCTAWRSAAERVERLAEADEAQGNRRAAGGKYARASGYYFTAERQTALSDPRRSELYRSMLDTFSKFLALRREPCARVEIPYENGTSLPALYVQGKGTEARKPCMVHFNGLDGNKEWLYLTGIANELAERGVSTLIVDNPGVGEALRVQGLATLVETEKPASICFEWLARRDDVDSDRIGMMALSLGGYYSMRALAFEPRFRCGVAWGAFYDFGGGIRRLMADNATHKSVHHILDHILWVTGAGTLDEALVVADGMTLQGILHRIHCPILIAHGEHDRQVHVDIAKRVYDEAINSKGKLLKIHSIAEGGSEHCSVDNISITTDFMAHWIARTLHAPSDLA